MASFIKKEVVLINPRLSNVLFNYLQAYSVGNPIPFSLLTLAALTPKDYKIKMINQKQFWRDKDFAPGALVGITCLTSAVFEAYQLADRFRRAGSYVVLGGPHVTALPQEALEHAHSVVLGEAESVWAQVILDFENDCLKKIYEGQPLEDFFTPVYDYFLNLDPNVLSRTGIHIDRGCKYHCEFCARVSNWLRVVKIEQVIELIKRIKQAKKSIFMHRSVIKFLTDNIYSHPSYAKDLFRKMIPLQVIWAASSSLDIGFDEEALQLAKKAGCQSLFIGFETIYPKEYKKTSLEQVHSVEDYKIAINNIRAHGIKVVGSFIIGLDEYGHKDYVRLLWFLMRARLWFFLLSILTPCPGSALFDRLKKENRIISFDWRKYFFLTCVIKPKRTSIFSVYAWFWLIRILSLIFSQFFLLLFFLPFVSLELGSWIGRHVYWLFIYKGMPYGP